MFSILIPTWNNLPYLKLCVESIRRHTSIEHEILVHVNEGTDGTLEWVREQGIRHTWSRGNVGVCLALNDVARLATHDWIVFLNDDMSCTPGWDRAFADAIAKIGDAPAYLSAQLIEPTDTGNDQIVVGAYGTGPENFDEPGMLRFAAGLTTQDRQGVALQPMVVSRRLWHLVGGYSIEFGPGMSSDDDFTMKLWLIGCRDFRVVGASRIYHFGMRSTGRVRRNKGGREFLMKWGMLQREFTHEYLRQTAKPGAHALPNVPRASFKSRLKRWLYSRKRYPFEDLEGWEANLPGLLIHDSSRESHNDVPQR
jgi:GT2 family glycosyltransferase